MRRRFGLLGERLGHSYSPLIYELLGLPKYELFPMPREEIAAFLRSGKLRGLNVTVPYKKTVLQFCDTLSESAMKLGNVNTLLFADDGRIYGDNTDYAGFRYMMERGGFSLGGKKVLVLGTGGAAQTAQIASLDAGAREVVLISRAGENNYENILRHKDAALLINATPVGMHPHEAAKPLSLAGFQALEGVADMIYNPLRTALLTEAGALGIRTIGGLSMLAEQGRKAAELFLAKEIPQSETLRVGQALQSRSENIVLVGMPGVGKTAIGQRIAENLKRQFVDTDALIEERTGRSAEAWIRECGEAAFREQEAEAVREAALGRGIVIATGGGAVLTEENRTALRRNGRAYWLRRPLEQLATGGRPLSEDLGELFERRRPFYTQASDVAVDLCDNIERNAEKIAEEFDSYLSAQWIGDERSLRQHRAQRRENSGGI